MDNAPPPHSSPYSISSTRIQDLPGEVRPRELALANGLDVVSDETLLAILIGSGGKPGQSVIDLARRILDAHHLSLSSLASASQRDLERIPGIGPVHALEIRAAFQLGLRAARDASLARLPLLRDPAAVADLLTPLAARLQQEFFWVLPLNTKYRLAVQPRTITRGLLNSSLVHAREVFREAIQHAAAAVILAHNHPSGDPSPSAEDLAVTRKLVDAGSLLGIPVLDHVVIGSNLPPPLPFHSMRDRSSVDFRS